MIYTAIYNVRKIAVKDIANFSTCSLHSDLIQAL